MEKIDLETLTFENFSTALKEYAEEVRRLYREKLIQDDKFASGKLIQNMTTSIKFLGTQVTVYLNLVDYWKYVEEGRGPGKWPPRDKILEWIKIKPVIPEPDKNGNLPTPEQLAFLIQRKIGEEGIEAGHQLRDTVQSINSWWIPKLQSALQKDFDIYTIKVFQSAANMIKI